MKLGQEGARWSWLLLALIVALGAWLRIARLGEQSMRGDTIEYWKLLSKGLTVSQIYFDKQQGASAHSFMAFPVAFVRVFLDVFRLPLNFFTVHLPWACWGIATIPLAFLCGRAVRGPGFGLLLAALLALSPFHMQSSREAYPYVIGIFGAFLGLWTILVALEAVESQQSLGFGFYLVLAVSLFLLLYACTTMWPYVAVIAGAIGLVLFCLRRQSREIWRHATLVALLFSALALPQLLGLIRQMSTGAIREAQKAIFGAGVRLFDWRGLRLVTNFAWGDSPLRVCFTAFAIGFGLWAALKDHPQTKVRVVLVCLGAGFFLQMLGRYWLGAGFAPRYAAPIFPLYLLFLAVGLVEFGDFLGWLWERIPTIRPKAQETVLSAGKLFCSFGPAVFGLVLLLRPAYLATRLTGQPTPYREITRWIDDNLPRGTPVLVDHWMDPWNQFAVHPATNAYLTYTVPNVPLELYLKFNWRDTAREFLEKFRDAAYLETAKTYWTDPRIGPWEWPRRYFARRVVFSNNAALELTRMGLSYRLDSWRSLCTAYTNQVVCELFYNTAEDAARLAKQRGEKFLIFFGGGWGYTKTRDYRDWRVMGLRATLQLYNLSEAPVQAILRISAVAVGRPKKIIASLGGTTEFAENRVSVWTAAPFVLAPGCTLLQLADGDPSKGVTPLLVGDVVLREVLSAGEGTDFSSSK